LVSEALTAVGLDLGATLIKLALSTASGQTEFRILPAHAIERVAREVESIRPERLGLTGGAAPEAASLLKMDTERVNEFEAWGHGAEELLRNQGVPALGPYLLVSVGTGTSILRIGEGKISRVGGSALGGGTIVGLGAGLVGTGDFERLATLARQGDRRAVDLLVSDVYRGPEPPPLPGNLNAASFAKLARGGDPARPQDLADALMGMVAENIGIICGSLAVQAGAERIVLAGGTLRNNPALTDTLLAVAGFSGVPSLVLADGEFAGALGALRLAVSGPGR
jgi:type II pantothenate kinase